MKTDKKYDAVKEARKVREQMSDEFYKDPEGFLKRVKEAGDRLQKRLDQKDKERKQTK